MGKGLAGRTRSLVVAYADASQMRRQCCTAIQPTQLGLAGPDRGLAAGAGGRVDGSDLGAHFLIIVAIAIGPVDAGACKSLHLFLLSVVF